MLVVVGVATGLPLVEVPSAVADPLPPLPTVPGLESPEPEPDAPTVPTGDFSLPPGTTLPDDPVFPGAPVQPGPVVERTISSTTYDNLDGTSTVRVHKGVVNFRDDKGVWRAIDRRITSDTALGDYRMIEGPFTARFGAQTGSGTLTKVAKDGWSLGVRAVGLTSGVHAEVLGGTATYPGVGPETDLVLEAGTDRVKETFRINAPLPTDYVPRFRSELDLEGLTPVPGTDGGIAFLDENLKTVAEMPIGLATDSNHQHDAVGLTPRTPVVPVLTKTADRWAVELTVDAAWLKSPDRVYPIFVDPTVVVSEVWQAGRDAGGADVSVGSGCGNCRYDGGNQVDANAYTNRIGRSTYTPPGTNATGDWDWRSYVFYDLAQVMRHNVTRATMIAHFYTAHTFPGMAEQYPKSFTMRPVSHPWDTSTVNWDNKPHNRAERIDRAVPDRNYAMAIDMTTWMQNWVSGAWPSWGVMLSTDTGDRYIRMAATEQAWMGWDPWIDVVINNTLPYHTQSQLVPTHGSTVTTLTPTLSAPVLSDAPENDRIQYWFRIGTVADAESGVTVNSGWLDTPTFTVPPGALRNGVSYHWKIFTKDQFVSPTPTYSSWPPAELKVDLRLGTAGPSPYDAVGPVAVNLATGNVTTTVSSPKFSTVGGPIGVDLTYNSNTPAATGLLGTYVDDADTRNTLVRRDPVIDFSWNTSPGPGIPAEFWRATWTGFVRVPTAGNWSFGARHDDNAKISVGSPYTVVLDRACCGGPNWGSPVSLAAGQRLPIKVEYVQGPGLSHLSLWADGPGSDDTTIVPSDWLSTGTGILPAGWAMSALTVDSLLYASATLNDADVVLVGPEGDIHRFAKQPDGRTWKPTNDADDIVVSTTEDGATRLVVEADDGLTYTFDGTGKLIRARSSLDDKGQTSPEYELDSATGNLSGIKDPVSGRKITLTYSPAGGGAGSCPTTGFSTPPAGTLCKLTHPDGTVSKLLYDDKGRLARIEDPGVEITDFAYDGKGRLSALRDPVGFDAVSALAPHNWPNDPTTRWEIAYHPDTSPAKGKAASLTAPIAKRNDTTRTAHSYDYVAADATEVDVAGITPPNARTFARRVTFDVAGRSTTDTGLDNLTATTQWEQTADRVLSQTDTTGRTTTTHYDHTGRATDVYGPAPAAWIGGDRKPVSGRIADVPRTTTAYDEGMRGLSAQFWDNAALSGPARLHRLGVGSSTGDLWYDWDNDGPAGLGATDNFSARFTGEVRFPAANYKVEGCADDGIRVWVDDALVVDRWGALGCTRSTWISPDDKPHRIRVEYREATANADLGLYWVTPGGTRAVVPGANLAPRYGLATSTVDADGHKTATRYAAPETGLATATVADPDGASGKRVTTETAFEQEGAGYRRRVGRRLPGNAYNSFVRGNTPAAHWRFEENYAATSAADDSGNGRTGTYPSNAMTGMRGVTGFDSSVDLRYAGVSAGDVFDFAGTSAFSVEAWVNPHPTASGYQRILSKEFTNAAGRQGWLLWTNNNTFGFERFHDGLADTVTGGATRPGQWTHVVATYDGTIMRLWVSGVEVASAASSRSLLDTTGTMYVGDAFRGRVDEAAVYTRAVPSWEVNDHWRAANYYLRSGLLDPAGAYWRLTEASGGTTALDSSGNGRHATFATTGVTYGEPGRVEPDTAVSTEGGLIATAGDVLDFTGTAHFSLEAWVKPTASDSIARRILSKEATDTSGRQGWSLWLKDGKVGFERVRDGGADKVEGGALTAGRWHHVFARWNGTMKVFVDGVEVATGSSTRSLLDTTGVVKIGDGFTGSMTHAVVYTVGPGTGAITRHYRDGIAQRATGTTHYLPRVVNSTGAEVTPAESRTNPCPVGGDAVQSGLPRLVAAFDPDGSSGAVGRIEEVVYDVMGRTVAARVNSETWQCTEYDQRGRVAKSTVPAFGSEPARTTTHNYAVGGDPLTNSVTDTAGSTTTVVSTTVDLLGRVVSHTDAWGKTTTTAYDQAGRVTQTSGPGGQVATEYRQNGWVDLQRFGPNVIARPTYNSVGETDAVSYPTGTGNRGNGTALAVLREDASGRTRKLTWTQAGGALLASDEVTRSVGGKVKDEKIDGVDHNGAGDNFAYDSLGRLTSAWVPGHTITYGFADSNSCGSAWTAGRSTNRTSVTDNATTYAYCYDSGDKLTSTTDPRYSTIAYDSRYNTTTLGGETLVYDGAGHHVATTKGTTTVRYVRDGLGRIVERKVNGATVARYSFGGSGDSPTAVLDTTNTVIEATIALLGGAMLTTRSTGDVWSYPNVHGDTMAVGNVAGVKVGSVLNYDPFGQTLGGTPDNSAGNLDYGWLGQNQRATETEAGIATVEMGARPYVPGLGRFLEVDPIEGGSANDYDYVAGDPVNDVDLDGRMGEGQCKRNPQLRICRQRGRGWRYADSGLRKMAEFVAAHVKRNFANAGGPLVLRTFLQARRTVGPVIRATFRGAAAALAGAGAFLTRLAPPVILFPTEMVPAREQGCRRCA